MSARNSRQRYGTVAMTLHWLIALLLIGVTEASRTFREDVTQGHVRVGHGLIMTGPRRDPHARGGGAVLWQAFATP